MKAALKVFARRGIINTKMSMIAAEADISHGLLYHYFKSKEELFTTLVEIAMTEAEDAMRQIHELPGSPIDRIKAFSREMLDEGGAEFFLLIHQARTSDGVPDKVKQLLEHHSMERFVRHLLPLFQEGQQAGQIVDGDPQVMIASYLSVLSGLMILNGQEAGGYRIPEIEMLLRMIARP